MFCEAISKLQLVCHLLSSAQGRKVRCSLSVQRRCDCRSVLNKQERLTRWRFTTVKQQFSWMKGTSVSFPEQVEIGTNLTCTRCTLSLAPKKKKILPIRWARAVSELPRIQEQSSLLFSHKSITEKPHDSVASHAKIPWLYPKLFNTALMTGLYAVFFVITSNSLHLHLFRGLPLYGHFPNGRCIFGYCCDLFPASCRDSRSLICPISASGFLQSISSIFLTRGSPSKG